MRRTPNNALEALARSTYKEIRIYYDDPRNKEKYKKWLKERNKRN